MGGSKKSRDNFRIMKLLAIFTLLASLSFLMGQTPGSDAAITALSVMGMVTDFKPDARQVIVTTAAGNQVTVTLSDGTIFMRIPPGEKTRDKFIKIAPNDFGVGDSVFARGRMSEDRKSLPAREFYVMSKGEIVQKRDREREQWRQRGIAGTISALNAQTKEISVDSRTAEGPKPIVISPNAETRFRRYAPDSVRFTDAKTGSFEELKVGDQLRALGSRNADGSRFTPEEIVSGSFQTIGGPIVEIKPDSNEIKITDLQTHQPMTIFVTKDTLLRRLTPELLSAITGAAPASGPSSPTAQTPPGNVTKASGDLQEMFDQLPAFTLQELKPDESILVSSTKGNDSARVVAIALVTGVGPLLQNSQNSRKTAVALGAMSLGGP